MYIYGVRDEFIYVYMLDIYVYMYICVYNLQHRDVVMKTVAKCSDVIITNLNTSAFVCVDVEFVTNSCMYICKDGREVQRRHHHGPQHQCLHICVYLEFVTNSYVYICKNGR